MANRVKRWNGTQWVVNLDDAMYPYLDGTRAFTGPIISDPPSASVDSIQLLPRDSTTGGRIFFDGAGTGLDWEITFKSVSGVSEMVIGEVGNFWPALILKDANVTVNGPLYIQAGGGAGENLRLTAGSFADRAFMGFYPDTAALTTRKAYIGFATTGDSAQFSFVNEETGGYFRWLVGGGERMRILSDRLLLGHTGSVTLNAAGAEISTAGEFLSVTDVGQWPFTSNHVGTADANGVSHMVFCRTSSATVIGNIAQVSTTGTAYNTSSDERLKEAIEPPAGFDALDVVRSLLPKWFKWKESQDEDFGLFAQECHRVWPFPVTVGRDDEGFPWSMDYGKLTPLLLAAVQELLVRLETLEGSSHG